MAFIGQTKDVFHGRLTLTDRRWVGKSRPVLINRFKTLSDDDVSIVSTKKIIQAISIGEQVLLTGSIKAHRTIDDTPVTELAKPRIDDANLNGMGGDVLI